MKIFECWSLLKPTARPKPLSSVIPLIAVLAIFLGLPISVFAEGKNQQQLHHERSLYRNIFVFEQNGVRCMRFSKRFLTGSSQSCMYIANPDKLFFDYASLMIATLYLHPSPERILVLGLGGGSIPAALSRLLPEAHIDVVEIDPAVSRVAEKYFDFTTSDRLKVHEVDGRVFIKRAARKGEKYDIVMLDAFNGDYIPEHLLTREFLQEVRQIISADGVLAANTFSRSKLYDSESVTYTEVFGDFFNANISFGNRVILWKADGLPSLKTMVQNADQFVQPFIPLGIEKTWVLTRFSRKKDWDEKARLLTDQYSPSNLLNR